MPAQTQCRIPDHERGYAGDAHRDQQRQNRLPIVLDAEDGGAIAADCRKGILAERGLAGITHEKIQPDAEDAVDHRELQHGDEVPAVDKHQAEEQRDANRAADSDIPVVAELTENNSARGHDAILSHVPAIQHGRCPMKECKRAAQA